MFLHPGIILSEGTRFKSPMNSFIFMYKLEISLLVSKNHSTDEFFSNLPWSDKKIYIFFCLLSCPLRNRIRATAIKLGPKNPEGLMLIREP